MLCATLAHITQHPLFSVMTLLHNKSSDCLEWLLDLGRQHKCYITRLDDTLFAHCKWMKSITTSLQHHDLLLLCVLCLLGHDFKVPSFPPSHGEVPDLSGSKWADQSFFSGDRDGEITGVHCHFQPSWWVESFIAVSHWFSCHVTQQATQEYCISIICSSVYHWIV